MSRVLSEKVLLGTNMSKLGQGVAISVAPILWVRDSRGH